MTYIYGKVQPSGLLDSTATRDWARWHTGGDFAEANLIICHTLHTSSSLATWLKDTTRLSEKSSDYEHLRARNKNDQDKMYSWTQLVKQAPT